MLNVTNSDIKKSDITSIDGTIFYDIMLVRKPMSCPYCNANMIGHGHKLRIIKHPALRVHKGISIDLPGEFSKPRYSIVKRTVPKSKSSKVFMLYLHRF